MALANLLIKIGADISELQTNTDRAVRTVERTSAKIDAIGSAISKTLLGAFSVTAVIAWADKTITAASRVDDLSKKLKVSTDALQRWDYTMNLSGGSIEDIDTALGFMNKTLGGGGTGVIKALNDVGLSFDEIRKMSPEQAFETIVTAIGNIKDPMAQAAAQVAIFGRSGGALFAAMSEGFVETGRGAAVMSAETIRRLDAAGDAWTRLGNTATVLSGELIASIFRIFDQPANEDQYAHKFFDPLHLDVQRAISDLQDLNRWLHVLGNGNIPKAPGAPAPFTAPRGAAPIELSDADARNIESNLNRVRKSLDEGAKAADEQRKKIDDLARSYRGMDVVGKANDALKAVNINLKSGFTVAQMTTDQIHDLNEMMGDAIDVFERHGKVAPQAMRDLYIETLRLPPAIKGITSDLLRMTEQVSVAIPTVHSFGDEFKVVTGIPFGGHIGTQVDLTIPKLEQLHDHLGDLSQSLSQLAQVAGGSFAGIAQALATLVSSADTARKGIDSFRDGIKDYKSGSTWEGILGITSGIAGIVSAAISAGRVLFDLFDRNKGRDLVVDFAQTLGGFDALHAKLLELGDEGEELWIRLTQGVGRNNPQQAQAAIEAVTAALNRQNSAQDKAQSATEEQAQATIETATQAAQALDELGGRLKTNADEWGDWSHRVTGYIDDIARSVRSIPTASPGGGGGASVPEFATGTRGGFVDFGAGRLVQLHGRERIVSEGESLGLSGGDTYVYIGNEQIDAHIVKATRKDAARGGLRPRASSGRSY